MFTVAVLQQDAVKLPKRVLNVMRNPKPANSLVVFVFIDSQISSLSLNRFLNKWKRYRPLWKLDKTIMIEKFAAKKPSCTSYDEKLQYYNDVVEDVSS